MLGPAGRPFTDEQAGAIRRRTGSLLLEANAGSGKTSVLVERFVRSVLEDDVKPGRILAITFTEKAAGELRARVRERFVELGEREQARATETAWVSTVHGFCARLLRAHAIAAGLDPAFTVLDEAASRAALETAWDGAFERWLQAEGEPALELTAAYDADRLRAAVAAAHDALRSAGHAHPVLPAPLAGPDPVALCDALRTTCAAAARALAGAGEGKQVGIARDRLQDCAALLVRDGLPGHAELAALRYGGGAKALKDEPYTGYLGAFDALRAALRDARAVACVALLDMLLGHYAAGYAEAKRTRGALDFDDLELRARDLLRGHPALRASYAGRFDRVMVDEFQDSNPLQTELFDMLDRDDLFLVGDEQQSIYGFRHADVEVFRKRRRELAAQGRVATLATSFRSRGPILAAVNAVFHPRFAPDFVALREGRPPPPAGTPPADHRPLVELLITGREGWEDGDAPVDLGELPRGAAWRHAEARLLAQRIRELVDADEARPEDVVVLVRALRDLAIYERALEDQGLLTLSVGGRGYWGRQVVRDLCAWLAALANPHDEEALYGVLASPLVGLSSDALAHVAAGPSGDAWRAIEEERVPGRLGDDDRERLAAFRRRFAAERELVPRLALDELLRRVVEATGYDLHVLGLPGGTRRLANVHKLQRLAAEYERDHGRDIRGLVDRATAEIEAESREADAPVELGDVKAVRLMTVHAAKGLEFGVVCIADLGRKASTDDRDDLLVRGGRIGLRVVGVDGSSETALEYDQLRAEARAAAAAEEERIFYVALTRAEERLILSGAVDLGRWPAESAGSAPPVGWLTRGLLGDLERLPTIEDPDRVVSWSPDPVPVPETGADRAVHVRCSLNTPETVGRVLRRESLAPAGTVLPLAVPQPPAVVTPQAAGAAPTVRTLSYSSLSAWRQCGYRFYLERILRLPEEDPPMQAQGSDPGLCTLDPRIRGSLVHALLEDDDPGAPPASPAALATAAPALAARHGIELAAAQLADVSRLVAAFALSPLRARLGAATSVRREHGFVFGLGDTVVNGIVDVLAVEPDGTHLIVDYKTDALASGADPAAYVQEGYAIQRAVYALAALHAGAQRVEVAYALLERPAEPVCAAFTRRDMRRLEGELRAAAAGPLGGDYPVTDRPHRELCETCPGRRALCSHDEQRTLTPRAEV